MTFLILLGWSARDGLWGRIEQVLLGALIEGQPPIRLSYHIDNTNKINVNILQEFAEKFPYLSIVPQQSADGGSGALVLPGLSATFDASGKVAEVEGSWARGLSDKRVTPFRIDSLPLNSPLWSWILSKPSARDLPKLDPAKPVLLVAASRFLFQEHFRYDVYLNAIMANRMVPCDLKALLPERLGRLDDIRYLVFEVKENVTTGQGKRSTVPSYQAFRVIWMDSFPTPEQTAMIVPLSTYEILLVAADRQSVDLYAETLGGGPEERISQIRLAETDLDAEGIPQFNRLASCLGAVPADVGGEREADGRKPGDICKTSSPADAVSQAEHRKSEPGDVIGSCESLRERTLLKYPRLISNGQDLLICSGEHRLLRGLEVANCAQSAGLKRLKRGDMQFNGRLDVTAVQSPPAIEWLGPSRIAVPCGALSVTDIGFAKALRSDRIRAAARLNAGTPVNAIPAGDQTDQDAWISECEAYKARNPTDSFKGPRAVFSFLGYQDVTVYPPPNDSKLPALRALRDEVWAFIRRGFQDFSRVRTAAALVLNNGSEGQPPDRALNSLSASLLSWETMLGRPDGSAAAPVLRLDPTYESALVRFGVLSLILDKISTPLAAGGLALYLFLTVVILSTATAHRRRQYGLLMMNGITPGDVGYIVAFQIVLSCILGGVAGYGVFLLTAFTINILLAGSAVVAEARMIIGLDVPSFLPSLGGFTIAALWGGMTFLAVLVGTLVLRMQGITTARAPIELVKS